MSATESISFSPNLSVISKPSDFENIASEENDESSIDFSKILGCQKDVSTLSKLKNLSNAAKLKPMRTVFIPSKSYVFPATARHFTYDWLEQYTWMCYSFIEDGAVSTVCCFLVTPPQDMYSQCISHTASSLMPKIVLKDLPRNMVFIKNQWKIMKACYENCLKNKNLLICRELSQLRKSVKQTAISCYK